MRRLAVAVCLLLVVVLAGSAFAALSKSDKTKLQRQVGVALDLNLEDEEVRDEARQNFTGFFANKRKAKELADVAGLTEVLANAAGKLKRMSGEVSFKFDSDGKEVAVLCSVPKKYNPSGSAWPLILAVPDKGQTAKDYLAKNWASAPIRAAYIIAVLDFDYSEVEEEVSETVKEEDVVKFVKKKVKKPFTWDHLRARGQWWRSFGRVLRELKINPNRVILDGAGLGATGNLNLSVGECWRFAGVIERGGEFEGAALANFASIRILSLPYATAGEKAGATTEALKKACGDNFTAGTNEPKWAGATDDGTEMLAWLDGCIRNRYPLPFKWTYTKDLHQVGHWVFLKKLHDSEKPASFEMEFDDKEKVVVIRTENVKQFNLFLNDLLVDLSKPIKIKINDADPVEYEVKRSADKLLLHADVNNTVGPWDAGCVFPADIEGIVVEPAAVKKDDEKKDDEKKDDK